MAKRSKPRSKGLPSRKGMLPGQYRKRSTVYVERPRRGDEEKRYGDEDLYTTDAYIVITNRLDGHWDHSIELRGEVIHVPDKVFQQIERHRKAIQTESAKVRGKERAAQLRARAEADQEEAVGSEMDWDGHRLSLG